MLKIKASGLLFIFGLLLAVFFASQTARAWNAEGHMVVAHMAYKHLNPVAKAKWGSVNFNEFVGTTGRFYRVAQ